MEFKSLLAIFFIIQLIHLYFLRPFLNVKTSKLKGLLEILLVSALFIFVTIAEMNEFRWFDVLLITLLALTSIVLPRYFEQRTEAVSALFFQLVIRVLITTAVWLVLSEQISSFTDMLLTFLKSESFLELLIVSLAYLLVLQPSSALIRLLLNPWITEISRNSISQDKLINAGQLIGFFERSIVLTMILLNQYTAIGFILAAKSVFRFGDLRESHERNLTEYVLLGTLASFTVTLFIGLATRHFL